MSRPPPPAFPAAAPRRSLVPLFVLGMLVSGCANSLLSKYQDMQCVEDCYELPVAGAESSSGLGMRAATLDGNARPTRIMYEQPVWQSLNMFLGEMLCCIPLLWGYLRTIVGERAAGDYAGRLENDRGTKRDVDGAVGNSSMFTLATQRSPSLDSEGEESPLLDATTTGYAVDSATTPDLNLDQTLPAPLPSLTPLTAFWLLPPAIFDILGTTLMNVGLILCPVSIYQMSRGALVMWVGVLSVLFLKRRLFAHQWTALACVMLGVGIVGLSGSLVKEAGSGSPAGFSAPASGAEDASLMPVSNTSSSGETERESPASVALGVLLILGAQCFTASQFVLEEKIMSWYTVPPLQAVALEGLFGFSTIVLSMPFLHYFLSSTSPFFDIPLGFHQTFDHPRVLVLGIAICFSIATFNVCGLSVTRAVSAAARSTVDTSRTLGIWAVSLLLGWEHLVWPFSLLQVLGFSLLVYGTFVFNGLVKPLFGGVPSEGRIHLAAEEGLLHGEVGPPESAGQGRSAHSVPAPDENL